VTPFFHQLIASRGPLAIGVGLAILTLGISITTIGVLTGFGLIALGASWVLNRKNPILVWVHLCVYLMLYGLFAGAVLTGTNLPDTATWRVLVRLDFAISFLLIVAVCRYAAPALLEEQSHGE
jgi:hypothetical protein